MRVKPPHLPQSVAPTYYSYPKNRPPCGGLSLNDAKGTVSGLIVVIAVIIVAFTAVVVVAIIAAAAAIPAAVITLTTTVSAAAVPTATTAAAPTLIAATAAGRTTLRAAPGGTTRIVRCWLRGCKARQRINHGLRGCYEAVKNHPRFFRCIKIGL
jgi:hypothetical protein